MSVLALLDLVMAAHQECARRPNASTQIILGAFDVNGHDFAQAVAAGLGSLGGKHGPIADAQRWLSSDEPNSAGIIPGYGSSFVKNRPDPAWKKVDDFLRAHYPQVVARLTAGRELLRARGLDLHPNAAAYTAAYGVVAELPPELTPGIFVRARLPVWMELCGGLLVDEGGERWEQH